MPPSKRRRFRKRSTVDKTRPAVSCQWHLVSSPLMESPETSHELAIRTSVAVLTGSAGMLGPDAGAAATALAPAMEAVLSRVAGRLSQRRYRHAAETLMDAADASSEPVEELVEKAVSDERRHELLARALGVAQDTSLRDKRRALGRALAAGIAGDDARIDDELLFIRAIADLDEPHIRLLALLGTKRAMAGDGLSGKRPAGRLVTGRDRGS